METVLLNACGLFLIILLGYFVKRFNLLSKTDGNILSKIIINITLPAAIILNLASLNIVGYLLLLILAGIVLNIIMILVGNLFSKKENQIERQFIMYTVSGYNIGNFALPFVQSFLPQAIPILSLFDLGNSIMLAGGSIVLTENLAGGEREKPGPRQVVGKLLKSPPFVAYVLMLFLRLLHVDFSENFLGIIRPIANANTFLSMFMIGLYLELILPKKQQQLVGRVLLIKYLSGAVLAVIFFLMPLPVLVKTVLCLLSVGPIPTFGVINSVIAGMNSETVGFVSSISFLISLPLMTLILVLFGI